MLALGLSAQIVSLRASEQDMVYQHLQQKSWTLRVLQLQKHFGRLGLASSDTATDIHAG